MARDLQSLIAVISWCLLTAAPAAAQYVVENLGRGVVAIRTGSTDVYVGWRLLGTDPPGLAFNVYRTAGNGPLTKLNNAPLTMTTDLVDHTADLTQPNAYSVRPVLSGVEFAMSAPFTLPANATTDQYLTVPLSRPPGGDVQVPPGSPTSSYTYSPNDASVADLDGDGEYEIVLKWDPSNSRDNASTGLSGDQILDAYKLDGTRLWRIDLGRNIRAGAHYTQFMVYDLDGDGAAEVACKTADGTVDGQGHVIGDAAKDYRSLIVPTDGVQVLTTSDARYGKVLAGPEYFTVFDGRTGAALATADYDPGRAPLDGWGGIGGNGNNDNNGNRADRFLAAVAYLDGRLPSVVMARGYYGRTVLAAWDWRNGQLTKRWVFDTGIGVPPFPYPTASPFSGQGNHNLSVADVDHDGKDEIVYGSMVVDDDGKGLFSTRLRHGDALHVGDLDPARPGLEVFGIHESEGATLALGTPGMALYDAATGQIVWSLLPGVDVGRGLEADVDPRFAGDEFWGASSVGMVDVHGQRISDTPSSVNFAVWWDADLLREIEDSTWISKWDWNTGSLVRLLTATDAASNNGTKATPSLSGDIFGDWREEVIWRASDNNSLRIYTTTVPATGRIYTLMHDPQYRVAIAWQNVGYNQPPHPGFFLGEGMPDPPRPNIVHQDTQPPVFKTLSASTTTLWPPNHRMVPVSVAAELVDLLDAAPAARIVSVSSNEPVDGADDGHTVPDWEITGDLSVNLRAERSGQGSGRVYTISVEGRDAAGNTTVGTVEVRVPVAR
jgi:rhamnogalacturonan endolyase